VREVFETPEEAQQFLEDLRRKNSDCHPRLFILSIFCSQIEEWKIHLSKGKARVCRNNQPELRQENLNGKRIDPNFLFCKFISESSNEGILLMIAPSLTCSGAFCFLFWIVSSHKGHSFHTIKSILHKTFHRQQSKSKQLKCHKIFCRSPNENCLQ
jgi:hypothetical protein